MTYYNQKDRMKSYERLAAIVSIAILAFVVLIKFEMSWIWILLFFVIIPLLAERIPLLGFLAGVALISLLIWALPKGPSPYFFLFLLAGAIYGGYLINRAYFGITKGSHAEVNEKNVVAKQSSALALQPSKIHSKTGTIDRLQTTALPPRPNKTSVQIKEALVFIKNMLDFFILLAIAIVSVPTFLLLLFYGTKWPLVLGLITFTFYLWQVFHSAIALSLTSLKDLRWHGLVLCICCAFWVLIIGLLPDSLLTEFNALLPIWMADTAWLEHGSLISGSLSHAVTLIVSAILITIIAWLPFLFTLLISGWLLIKAYYALPADIETKIQILRWPFMLVSFLVLLLWSDISLINQELGDWISQYQIPISWFVEILIIGFLPWKVWQIIFKS